MSAAPTVAPRSAEEGRASDDPAALRRDHDALARQLSARRSIDELRKAAYAAFFGFIASGMATKLAWDRWFSLRVTRFKGPPVFFFVALAVAVALIAVALVCFLRARRHMRSEDEAFAKLRALRDRLGLDP